MSEMFHRRAVLELQSNVTFNSDQFIHSKSIYYSVVPDKRIIKHIFSPNLLTKTLMSRRGLCLGKKM